MERDYAVGIGEVLWDVLPDGRKPGGAPSNFAYHVSRFGLPGMVVSAVGADSLGQELLENFKGKGISCMINTVPYPTGTVQVSLAADGIPCYDIKEGTAWDNIPFTADIEDIAKHTRAVYFGSLAQRSPVSRNTVNRFLDSVPEGCLKVFDINLRQDFYSENVISKSLHRCNILKINDEELEIVSRMFSLGDGTQQQRCGRLLSLFGLKALILTCGAVGSYVFSPAGTSYIGTPRVEVADTVGAGDSFTAAFTSGILSGMTMEEAHRLAVDTSAFVCTQDGAMPELPSSLTSRCRNHKG